MTIRCIIFDLDGVLVDACDWHYEALNRALYEFSGYTISREDHLNRFNGSPTKTKLSILTEEGHITKDQISEICNLKQEYTKEVIKQYCTPNNTLLNTLDKLKNYGYLLGCYTNSINETGLLMIKLSGCWDYLNLFLSCENVSNPKPSPEGYIECMKRLNVLPEETCIVEDSPKGFKSALASGAKLIKVKNSLEVTLDLFKREKLL